MPYADYIKYTLEVVVLLLILREIRALRRHEGVLEQHQEELRSSRPLYTTLYTDATEIMEFAVAFTRDAKRIDALGTIASLRDTELRPGESEISSSFKQRLGNADPLSLAYVTANRDFVLSGREYRRIIDFRPATGSSGEVLELLASSCPQLYK
jgi:hypothetical protein